MQTEIKNVRGERKEGKVSRGVAFYDDKSRSPAIKSPGVKVVEKRSRVNSPRFRRRARPSRIFHLVVHPAK